VQAPLRLQWGEKVREPGPREALAGRCLPAGVSGGGVPCACGARSAISQVGARVIFVD
jgi:hypothetical protein